MKEHDAVTTIKQLAESVSLTSSVIDTLTVTTSQRTLAVIMTCERSVNNSVDVYQFHSGSECITLKLVKRLDTTIYIDGQIVAGDRADDMLRYSAAIRLAATFRRAVTQVKNSTTVTETAMKVDAAQLLIDADKHLRDSGNVLGTW